MADKYKKFFFISLALNILGVVLLSVLFVRFGGLSYLGFNQNEYIYTDNIDYGERIELFSNTTIPENSIIFVGDSLTQRGLWNELLPEGNTINRGINSDSTEGVYNRLDEVIESKPSDVFLMIGINDLRYEIPTVELLNNYKRILNKLHKEIPETKVYVQSILPVRYDASMDVSMISNKEIKRINSELVELANELGYEYVDLHSLYEESGEMNNELTTDGIHLNGEGYRVWKDILSNYVYK